jgi:hypothetical protein
MTEQTRQAVDDYLKAAEPGEFPFTSRRRHPNQTASNRPPKGACPSNLERLSLRADDIGEFSRMRPHKGVVGTINQSADSAGYCAHQSIEVTSRDSAVVRASDNQRGRSYLFEPRPAVECNDPSDRAAHGGGAIGGQYGLHPFGLFSGKSYRASRLRF